MRYGYGTVVVVLYQYLYLSYPQVILTLYQHAHVIPILGVGKERRTLIIDWSIVTCKKGPSVTGTTLKTNGPVPADSRQ